MRQLNASITDQSQVGQARRDAVRLAQDSDFNELCIGKVALIATEIATNLVKHAVGGQLLMRVSNDNGGGNSFEFLALDRGPGIASVTRCMEDGHSTAGSPGAGLGAIRRTADQFDMFSQQPTGTVVVARVISTHTGPIPSLGVVHQAKSGESMCGDAWLIQACEGEWRCVVADGLGHGPLAATAATAIIDSIRQTVSTKQDTSSLIEVAHQAAKATCGAAVGIAIIDSDSHEVRFSGVGNISGAVLNGDTRHHLVSYDGVIGHEYRIVKEFLHPWSKESVLVMHSDGIGTRWDLRQYPELLIKDPSLIAGVLYRDYVRPHDDVTVVVVKETR